jgi:tripartite-type tricarboxylate transporter receptor subunit TctC
MRPSDRSRRLAMPAAIAFLLGLISMSSTTNALAQTKWPDRPIKVVVAYPAGSTGDNIMRAMSDDLRVRLGQPVIIENKVGAGGNIAALQVAKATPDGYTLLVGAANNFAANQFLYKDMGFDPVKAFEPIAALADVPAVLFVNSGLGVDSFSAFTDAAKKASGKMNYGSPGTGTPPHLAAELINRAAGWNLVHIPYKGSPFTVTALLGNEIQLMLAAAGVGAQHVASGKLRALAVGAPTRLPEFPNAPTLSELGLGQIKASTWWGLAAPKGTPAPVVATLGKAFKESLSDPKIAEGLKKLGTIPMPNTDLGTLIREDAAYWEKAIGQMAIRID